MTNDDLIHLLEFYFIIELKKNKFFLEIKISGCIKFYGEQISSSGLSSLISFFSQFFFLTQSQNLPKRQISLFVF